MRLFQAGISGSPVSQVQVDWCDLQLGNMWEQIVTILQPGTSPKRIQSVSLREYRILENRRNIIISAPTNSGKSLLGWLILLDSIRRGKRAILLEPLRAIAREKYDELHAVEHELSNTLGTRLRVKITTGDYRLDDEWLTDPPPQSGEIVIATPERLDAILRNPAYAKWFSTIGAVCLDEAHLISTRKRGATMEYLITTLLSLEIPPRIVLLSATLGDTKSAEEWLSPCDLIQTQERTPALYKEVIELEPEDDANKIVAEKAKGILEENSTNLLIFVYQTKSAEYLAKYLNQTLGTLAGEAGVLPYHSRMHSSMRASTRSSFSNSSSRCVVTTTALGLGVNMPATHVILRDVTFPGVGRLKSDEIIQMMGRAGRGTRAGYASALVRPNDAWQAGELVSALLEEKYPDLTSQFGQVNYDRPVQDSQSILPLSANLVAAYLARYQQTGKKLIEIQGFFGHSLGRKQIVAQIPSALGWLSDPARALAYCDEFQSYHLTVLGQKSVQSMLPIEMASSLGQFVRDLLSVDATGRLFDQWQLLDHLLILSLLHKNTPSLRPFSKSLVRDIDVWMESHPRHIPLLYRQWIAGDARSSRATEVLGSLDIQPESKNKISANWAYKIGYLAVFSAIILYERGQGISEEDIERRWSIKNLSGVEERWRDDFLWLLSGLAKLFELRCFYYHLKETCNADAERIQQTKRSLGNLRMQCLELQERLKYCSPLGPVLRSIRKSTRSTVGFQTIRKLEISGITSMEELARLSRNDLIDLGIRKSLAEQIYMYCRRRSL